MVTLEKGEKKVYLFSDFNLLLTDTIMMVVIYRFTALSLDRRIKDSIYRRFTIVTLLLLNIISSRSSISHKNMQYDEFYLGMTVPLWFWAACSAKHSERALIKT